MAKSNKTKSKENMSEVLKRFAEPYMSGIETKEMYNGFMATVVFAWNMSFYEEDAIEYAIQKAVEEIPKELRDEGKEFITELMKRKEKYFSHYKRMISGYEIREYGSDLQLFVACDNINSGTLPPPNRLHYKKNIYKTPVIISSTIVVMISLFFYFFVV